MKFLRLDLRAYGPFDGVDLDFPADGPGLHLIHGPNEAGKSSALRALRALLFGFPARTADNHRHEYKDLRVGATLLNPGGATLSLVRRKANAKTLRGPDDEEILPDDALSPFLGGISEERFAAIATSNLADLIRGGVDIISGRGDFGEILFGAGGLSRLPEVRRLLEAEAEELFKKGSRATNPRINAALGGLEAARRTAREKSLSSDEWRDAARAVDDALAKLDALGARLGGDERELRRLERLDRALPQLAARLDVLARLELLGDVPLLPEPFAERRQNAVAERGAAIEAARTSRQEIAAIEAELASIEVPDRLLAESKAIGGLREELGGLRKARARRPRLVEEADEAEAAALTISRDLAPSRSLDDAGSLRLTKPQRSSILALEREWGAIDAEVARAGEGVRALTARVVVAPHFEGPDQRHRLDELAALVARIQSRGDLEEADIKALAEVRRLESEADDELARLPRWSGSLDDLSRRPVPPDSAVSHLETSLAKAEAELQTADANVRTNAAEIASIDEQAEGFRAGGVPPSDADLARTRADRDAEWGEVRRAWIEGDSDIPPVELALRFEHRVALADRLADALRREADRVSARAALEARRRRLVGAGDGLGAVRAQAASRLDALEEEWARLWQAAGIDAGSPSEMRAWANLYRDLVTRAGLIRSARLAAEATGSAVAAARASLDAALRGLCEPRPSSLDDLAALLACARFAIERGETSRALALGRRTLSDAEARREAWQFRWDEAVRPLGLGPDVVPEVVRDSLDRLDALFDRLAESRRIRREVEEIDRDAARFAEDVVELSRRLGRSGGEGEPEAVAQAMSDALEEAERDQSRRLAAQARLKLERDRLDLAEAVVRDREALIDALVREARCGSADDLPAVERASAQVRMLRDRLDSIEADLLALGGGAGLDELIAQAEGIDVAIVSLGDPGPCGAGRGRPGDPGSAQSRSRPAPGAAGRDGRRARRLGGQRGGAAMAGGDRARCRAIRPAQARLGGAPAGDRTLSRTPPGPDPPPPGRPLRRADHRLLRRGRPRRGIRIRPRHPQRTSPRSEDEARLGGGDE